MDYHNGNDSGSMTIDRSDNGHDNSLGEQVMEQASFMVYRAQDAARVAAARVRENPLPVIVVAAGIAGIGIAGFLITRQLRKKTVNEYAMDATKLAVRTGKQAANRALNQLDSMEIDEPSRYADIIGRMPAVKKVHQLAKILRA